MQIKGLPVEGQRSAVRPFEEIQAPQQRGLARPAGAQNGDHVALIHLQTHILQNGLIAEGLADIVDPKKTFTLFACRPVCHRKKASFPLPAE